MANKFNHLDRLVSEYVRKRDTQKDGFIRCFICSKKISYSEAQNCHYISRQHIATRFNLINCNAGCISCNCFDPDHEKRYRAVLVKKYGEDTVEEFKQLKNTILKLSLSDIKSLEQEFKDKIKQIECERR